MGRLDGWRAEWTNKKKATHRNNCTLVSCLWSAGGGGEPRHPLSSLFSLFSSLFSSLTLSLSLSVTHATCLVRGSRRKEWFGITSCQRVFFLCLFAPRRMDVTGWMDGCIVWASVHLCLSKSNTSCFDLFLSFANSLSLLFSLAWGRRENTSCSPSLGLDKESSEHKKKSNKKNHYAFC